MKHIYYYYGSLIGSRRKFHGISDNLLLGGKMSNHALNSRLLTTKLSLTSVNQPTENVKQRKKEKKFSRDIFFRAAEIADLFSIPFSIFTAVFFPSLCVRALTDPIDR